MEISPERLEEFAPGLDTDLMEPIQQTAEMEMADIDATFGKMSQPLPFPIPASTPRRWRPGDFARRQCDLQEPWLTRITGDTVTAWNRSACAI